MSSRIQMLALWRHLMCGVLFSVFASMAYAEVSTSPNTPTALRDRVQAYWNAIVAGDPITAYEFEQSKADGLLTLSQYARKSGKIAYQQVKLLNVEIIASDKALALLEVEYLLPGFPSALKNKIKDTWVKLDSGWYHMYRSTRLGGKS